MSYPLEMEGQLLHTDMPLKNEQEWAGCLLCIHSEAMKYRFSKRVTAF